MGKNLFQRIGEWIHIRRIDKYTSSPAFWEDKDRCCSDPYASGEKTFQPGMRRVPEPWILRFGDYLASRKEKKRLKKEANASPEISLEEIEVEKTGVARNSYNE